MRPLLLLPLVLLAIAFAAGFLAGVALLAAVPVTRRLLARRMAELQRQAATVAQWQAALRTYRACGVTVRQEVGH